MENKRIDATVNRPEGERVLDAPYIFINIPEFIRQLKAEEAWQKNDRNGITVFKTQGVTMVLMGLHSGAVVKNNLVDGIFTIQVLEGIVRITTPEGAVDMLAGHIMAFHQLAEHTVEALMESVLLLTNNIAD